MRSYIVGGTLLGVLACLAAVSPAGVVADLDAVYGPIGAYGGATAVTLVPNNDNVLGASPNTFVSEEIEFTALGPIDLVLNVSNSGGTTEYFLDVGTVRNSTGVDWHGLRLTGGSGYGGDFERARETPAGIFSAPPGFDYDVTPSSSVFDLALTEEDTVEFSGGGVLHDGEAVSGLNFAGDVPDIVLPGETGYQFTLRLEPLTAAVPEPSTLAYVGALLAALGIGAGWRRK